MAATITCSQFYTGSLHRTMNMCGIIPMLKRNSMYDVNVSDNTERKETDI